MSRGDGVAAGGDSCEHERLRDRGDSRLIGGHIITRHHIDPLSVGGIIADHIGSMGKYLPVEDCLKEIR